MKTQNKKLMVALLCGAAAGAALGVLFAPSSGSDLRKIVSDDTLGLKKLLSVKLKEMAGMVDHVKAGLGSKMS